MQWVPQYIQNDKKINWIWKFVTKTVILNYFETIHKQSSFGNYPINYNLCHSAFRKKKETLILFLFLISRKQPNFYCLKARIFEKLRNLRQIRKPEIMIAMIANNDSHELRLACNMKIARLLSTIQLKLNIELFLLQSFFERILNFLSSN